MKMGACYKDAALDGATVLAAKGAMRRNRVLLGWFPSEGGRSRCLSRGKGLNHCENVSQELQSTSNHCNYESPSPWWMGTLVPSRPYNVGSEKDGGQPNQDSNQCNFDERY